jgi:hypothetical protein
MKSRGEGIGLVAAGLILGLIATGTLEQVLQSQVYGLAVLNQQQNHPEIRCHRECIPP